MAVALADVFFEERETARPFKGYHSFAFGPVIPLHGTEVTIIKLFKVLENSFICQEVPHFLPKPPYLSEKYPKRKVFSGISVSFRKTNLQL